MKRVLAIVALLAFLPTAHAQDKGKSAFSYNGEFRVRDTFEQNESGNSSVQPSHHNGIDQRFKLGGGFKLNEKLSVNATLLQSATWGQRASETLGVRDSAIGDFVGVNEAYATWLMSDAFGVKVGRQNFSFGDGSIMSVNDWQTQPYAFDGVTGHYELEFGRFQAFAFKYRDLSGPLGTNFQNLATTSDPQHEAYGVVFDLKTMPDWLKMVNAYVIQDIGDGVGGTSSNDTGNTVMTNQGQNALRYGLLGSATFSIVDFKAGYNMVTGKNTDFNANASSGSLANLPSRNINENMLQAEVGVNFPAFMLSRLYLSYHQDSGTNQNNWTTNSNTYDPYFTDKYTGAGLMQLVGWGNLTDISLGWTAKPTDNTDVGIAYSMFTKTQQTDYIHPGVYGTGLFSLAPAAACTTTGAANAPTCQSGIGDEMDMWAEHHYDGGLSMLLRLGEFLPGSQLKDPVLNQTSAITQVMVQGKLVF